MKYTEEYILKYLAKGDSFLPIVSPTQVKRLYYAIEEDLPDYYDYYTGSVFIWKVVNGY
jgi:hypothetical protein